MSALDWIIVAAVVLLALFGYRQGLIVGLLSLLGLAVGAVLGTRLGPALVPRGSASPYAPLFALTGALLAGAVLASGLGGLGERLRRRLTLPGLAALDGALGAVLTATVALGVAWVLGAVALQTPGARELRREVQRSSVLTRLYALVPPSGGALRLLARFDPLPGLAGPSAEVAAPRAAVARDPDVRAAAAGVVRVLGTACGLGVEGSGWVAAPGLVVTNAHVVAGQDDTEVLARGREPGLRARAVAFDVRNDLAVLRVPGLVAPALPLAGRPRAGAAAAILGFPENGPYDVRAGRLGSTVEAVTQDAYGRGPVRRRITSLRGVVRSGNSGGPMVDTRGRVVTTVFAATTGGRRGGYGVPNDLVRAALAGAAGPVGTGPCAR